MPEIITFFVLIAVGLAVSGISSFFHLPWVLMLVAGGFLLGPNALDIVVFDSTFGFIAEVGLIFLMFMAGLETTFHRLFEDRVKTGVLSFINGFIPFLAGYFLTLYAGFGNLEALFMGLIFVSSSITLIVPSLKRMKITSTSLGRVVLSSTVLQEIFSITAISILIGSGTTSWYTYPLAAVVILGLRLMSPRLKNWFHNHPSYKDQVFEIDVRVTLLMIFGAVLSLALLGFDLLVASFVAGLILSDTITDKYLIEKLRTMAYGIFIPIFFIKIGADIDVLGLLTNGYLLLTLGLLVALLTAKYFSGYLAGRLLTFRHSESSLIAAASLPKLSSSLALGFTAFERGAIEESLLYSVVTIVLVTSTISPFLIQEAARKMHKLGHVKRSR